jgi:hypothetical protein
MRTSNAPGATRSTLAKSNHEGLARAMKTKTARERELDSFQEAVERENVEKRLARKRQREEKRKREQRSDAHKGDGDATGEGDDGKKQERRRQGGRKKTKEQQQQQQQQQQPRPQPPNKKRRLDSVSNASSSAFQSDPALFGGAPETPAEFAVVAFRGKRAMDREEVDSFLSLDRASVKPKTEPHEYAIPTSVPPSGDNSVVAARRTLIDHQAALHREAVQALDNRAPIESAQERQSAIPVEAITPSDMALPPYGIMQALETRTIHTIDPSFYREAGLPEGAAEIERRGFLLPGHAVSEAMADAYRRPARIPSKPIEDAATRRLEQGQPVEAPTFINDLQELEWKALADHVIDVNETSIQQPMLRFLNRYEKADNVAHLNLKEQLIFDTTGYLGDLTPVVERWIARTTNPSQSTTTTTTTPAAPSTVNLALSPETGFKQWHKDALALARNTHKQHDASGYQARFNPARQRRRFDYNKTKYCIDLLNKKDTACHFPYDRVAFARGKIMTDPRTGLPDGTGLTQPSAASGAMVPHPESSQRIVMPQRSLPMEVTRKTRSLLESTRYGMLGTLVEVALGRQRYRFEEIAQAASMIGKDFHYSAYDLGTARLHPDSGAEQYHSPISLRYHAKYMVQPNPDIPYERECARGENCWCYSRNSHLADAGTYFSGHETPSFVCREFLLPDQETKAQQTGELPAKRNLCILCYMREVSLAVNHDISNEIIPKETRNNHSVYVDMPGEYISDMCYPISYTCGGRQMSTGIIGHFPMFNENNFIFDVYHDGPHPLRYVRFNPAQSIF